MRSLFSVLLAGWLGGAAAAAADEESFPPPALFPLEAIRAGMTGTTYTVLRGATIEPIHTEIYGVLRDAVGPGHHLIVGRLNDEKTRLTFAVHGMSGSPLYVDGKLAGALSRRVTLFEKDAYCGFTPIRDMLELERSEPPSPRKPAPGSRWAGAQAWFRPLTVPDGTSWQPLLTPLVVAGLTPRALAVWTKEFADLNFLPLLGSAGGPGEEAPLDGPFAPGAPLAAVLARGSFTIGATGTMTYREGDRVLGFGHPLMWLGSVRMPMARAEIIATVPSYSYPHKISGIRQVIGTITQDRLTAIGGEVGPVPALIPMEVAIVGANGRTNLFHQELFDHPLLTPRLVGGVLASTTLLSLHYSEEFSMDYESEVELENLPPVRRRDVYSGDDAARFASLTELAGTVDALYNNPFAMAKITRIAVRAVLEERRREFEIVEARLSRDTVKPGGTVTVRITFRGYQGEERVESFALSLPEELKHGEAKLLLGDAEALRRAELGWGSGGKTEGTTLFSARLQRENPRSLEQLIEVLNRVRPGNCLYYRLSRSAPGQLVQHKRLGGLPPSALAVRESRRQRDDSTRLGEAELLEGRLPLPGVVRGSAELTLRIE